MHFCDSPWIGEVEPSGSDWFRQFISSDCWPYRIPILYSPHPTDVIGVIGIVPLDFKIRRILLPIEKISRVTNFAFHSHPHTSDNLDLSNAVAITENNTNLRGGSALLGELANVVNDLVGGGLQPGRRAAGEGDGGRGNALALAVEATGKN